MSKYHSEGILNMDKNILRFMFKNIWYLEQTLITSPDSDKPVGEAAFVRPIYFHQ